MSKEITLEISPDQLDVFLNQFVCSYARKQAKKKFLTFNSEKSSQFSQKSTKSSEIPILSSHWVSARKDIQKVRDLIGERKVKSISPIEDGSCMESFPCQGHEGVKIIFKDGEVIKYNCRSVSIGCIQKAIMGKTGSHFRIYTEGFTP
jgi:hypothetical protein